MPSPLNQEESNEYLTLKGYNPTEFSLDQFTGEIKPRVKAQPTMSPTTAKPASAWEAGWKTAALGVLPNAAAFGPALAAGAKVGAMTAPVLGPWSAIPAIGAGLVVGAGVGSVASAVQDAALNQFEGGRKFVETTAKAAEEHPIASVVGNVASTLPFMKVNGQMLKDAAHALTTEARGGAGLLNKLATSQAAQNVLISGGVGGAMSVGEDLHADKPIDIPKALLQTALFGAVSDTRPNGVGKYIPGLRGLLSHAAYKGQPHAVLNDAQMRSVATETTTPGVVDPELAAKRQAKLEKMAEERKILEEANMFAENEENKLFKAETVQKLQNLEKRRKALEATIAKPVEPTVETVLSASDELKKWGTEKGAQQGVPKVEFEDTGMVAGKGNSYGSFTPEEIKASTFAAKKGPKDEDFITNLPEYSKEEAKFFGWSKDLLTTGDPVANEKRAAPTPKTVASTIIHEPMHAWWDNVVRSERPAQRAMGEKLAAAIERDPRYQQWKEITGSSQPTPEEYLVRSASRDFLTDPGHKNRSWAEERRALKRLDDGKADANDAVRIAGMKFRYDSQLAAPRVTKAPVSSTPKLSEPSREVSEVAPYYHATTDKEAFLAGKTDVASTSKFGRKGLHVYDNPEDAQWYAEMLKRNGHANSEVVELRIPAAEVKMDKEALGRAWYAESLKPEYLNPEQRLSEPSADVTAVNADDRQARVKSYIDTKKAEPDYSSAMNRTKGWNPDITSWRKAAVADFLGVSEPTYNGMVKKWEKDGVSLADGIFNYGRTRDTYTIDKDTKLKTVQDTGAGKTFEDARQEVMQEFQGRNPAATEEQVTQAFDTHLENLVLHVLNKRTESEVRRAFLNTDRLSEEGVRKADAFLELVDETKRNLIAGNVGKDSLDKKTGELIPALTYKVRKVAQNIIRAKVEKSKLASSTIDTLKNELGSGAKKSRASLDAADIDPTGNITEAATETFDELDVNAPRRDYGTLSNRGVLSKKLSPAQAETLNRTVAAKLDMAAADMENRTGADLVAAMDKHTKELETLLYQDPKRAKAIVEALQESPENLQVIADQMRSGKLKLSEPSREMTAVSADEAFKKYQANPDAIESERLYEEARELVTHRDGKGWPTDADHERSSELRKQAEVLSSKASQSPEAKLWRELYTAQRDNERSDALKLKQERLTKDSSWDVEPPARIELSEDSPAEAIRASQFKAPSHSTDLESVDSILSEGLRSGSALDATPDRGWAGDGVSLIVPFAKKGTKIEHNDYYKSSGGSAVGRVIVDAGAYGIPLHELETTVQGWKKKHPEVKMEIIDEKGRIIPVEAAKQFSEPSATTTAVKPYEPDNTKQGFLEAFAPQYDKVSKRDVRVGQAFKDTEQRQQMNEAKYVNVLKADFNEAFPNATKEDRKAAQDYARAKYRGLETAADLTPEQEAMAKMINEQQSQPVRIQQRAQNMLVETPEGFRRAAKLSKWYVSDQLSKEAIEKFTNSHDRGGAEALKLQWANHVVAESERVKKPVTLSDALYEINQYVDAMGKGGASHEFAALRKSAGFGLPDSIRERDILDNAIRYGRRASRDLAINQHLESDPFVGAHLGLEDPATGIRYPEPVGGRLIGNEDVRDAMRMITGNLETKHSPRLVAAARAVTNALLGLPSGLRDFATIPVNALPYVKSIPDAVNVFTSLLDVRKNWRTSLETGARTGSHPLDRMDVVESVDGVANAFNKTAEFLRKYQGRDFVEQVNRAYTFSIGKNLAIRAVADNNTAFLKKFGSLAKTTAADGTVTWDTNILAKSFVDRNQGTYGGRGLPIASVDGMAAPWFALSRWSLEKSSVIYQDVIKPAYIKDAKGELNFMPLLTYAFGAYLTGQAIEKLNEEMNNGKKSANPSPEELEASDASIDRKVARLVNIMQLGSFAGMASDALKIGSDIVQGNTPRGYNVPTADFIANGITGSLVNFSRAMREGADPLDTVGILGLELLKNQVQTARVATNWANDDEVARKNRFRDLRVWKQMTGREVPSGFNETNPAVRPEERQLKRATTPEEVAELLPKILDGLVEKHKDNPWALKKAIERLKSNSYQTFPSPKTDGPDAMAYYDYLVKAVGKEEADARLEDYVQQSGFNRGKSAMLKSGR